MLFLLCACGSSCALPSRTCTTICCWSQGLPARQCTRQQNWCAPRPAACNALHASKKKISHNPYSAGVCCCCCCCAVQPGQCARLLRHAHMPSLPRALQLTGPPCAAVMRCSCGWSSWRTAWLPSHQTQVCCHDCSWGVAAQQPVFLFVSFVVGGAFELPPAWIGYLQAHKYHMQPQFGVKIWPALLLCALNRDGCAVLWLVLCSVQRPHAREGSRGAAVVHAAASTPGPPTTSHTQCDGAVDEHR